MAERSIELAVGDVVRIGDLIVSVQSIEGDEVTFEIVSDVTSDLAVRLDELVPDSPRSIPR